MSRRGGASAIAANPVLVGVATVLVVIVAVFLSYNANNGLPWIPSYRVEAVVPSATNLVEGNEVRVGGTRVGILDSIEPLPLPNGRTVARLGLKLETRVKPLPVDSKVLVRPRSALGLKYVEISLGDSTTGFAEGATIPLKNATLLPVDIDEFFNMFTAKTRVGIRGVEVGIGDGLAGRGEDLNSAIHTLPPMLRTATKVFANIANPKTEFDRLFASLARTVAIVAPVAQVQADLFANLDTTFIALASVASPFLEETISKGPDGLQTATDDFPKIRPLLRNTEKFVATLAPGAAALRRSAPDLADGVEVGVDALAGAPRLNKELGKFFTTLQAFAENPFVPLGFNDLFQTVATLDPLVAHLTPAETTCNYLNLFFRNVAGVVSEGDSRANWLRFAVLFGPDNNPPNSLWGPAAAPAAGGGTPLPIAGGGSAERVDPNFLHNNQYPNTASPGQPKECEAGNEPYAKGQTAIGNPPGTQSSKTEEPAKKKDDEN